MSVTTTTDEKIQSAKDHLSIAYKELLIVLDEDTWGHNGLDELYINTIHEITIEILKLKRKL